MTFKTNVIRSFIQVKQDIANLKDYVFDWLNIIVNNQKRLLEKIKELEQRVQKLEQKARK